MSQEAVLRDPVEQLAEEFLDRLRKGERPSLTEYTSAHPQLADDIRDLFPALVMMEEVKQSSTEAQLKPASFHLMPSSLGDYRIIREVGRGGMGTVYEAEQITLGRHVALKVIPPESATDPMRLLRFRREARSAAKLHHTNIVPVFEVGSAEGMHYYTMQFIQGQGLDEVLRELNRLRSGMKTTEAEFSPMSVSLIEGLQTGMFPNAPIIPIPKPKIPTPRSEASSILREPVSYYFRSVSRLGVQAAEALEYAHGQRVLHRDVKPSNLLLDQQGILWLTDFGLAKEDGDDLTRTGDIVGTLRYMAPERFQGVSDPRTDVYALGITLYEMLTLRPAFPETDRVRLIQQVTTSEPIRPRLVDPTIPKDLETIILKAIEKEPNRRYHSAGDMAEDLRRFLTDRPIRARRASWREQMWRWCRRNRGVAISLAFSLLFLLLLVVGLSVGYLLVWQAKKDVEIAKGQVEQTLAQETLSLYFQRIALIDRELAVNNINRARELLDLCPPELRKWEWHYLNRSRGRPPMVIKHPNPTSGDASLSPDGKKIAIGGLNGTLTIWDLTNQTNRVIQAHQADCSRVRFSPDGSYVASANKLVGKKTGIAEIKFWDTHSGKEIHSGWKLEHGSNIRDIQFSPTGDRLAISSTIEEELVSSIQIREVPSGRLMSSWKKKGHDTPNMAFSPNGQFLAAGDVNFRVYDSRTGEMVYDYRDPRSGNHGIWSVAFSPDGKQVAAGFGCEFERDSGGIHIWDVETWDRSTISGHDVFSLAWGPNGRMVTGGSDGAVRVWDIDRGQELVTFRDHIDVVWTVAFTPDYNRLISFGADRCISIWDATPVTPQEKLGDELVTFHGHSNCVKALAFHPTKPILATGSADGTVRLHDTRNLVAADRDFLSGPGSAHAVAISPNGELLAVGFVDNTSEYLFLLDVETGKPRVKLDSDFINMPHRLAFSPDSQFLAGCDVNGKTYIWNTSTGQATALSDLALFAYGIAFGPDRQRPLLAAATTGGEVRIWDPTTGKVLKSINHKAACAVAFSPDGKQLATVGWDRVIRIWRTSDWSLSEQFRDPTGGPNSIAFSPDNTLVVWGGTDSTVKVWKLGSDEVVTLRGHTNWVWDVAFSPKGDAIASAGRDGTVKMWKTPLFQKPK